MPLAEEDVLRNEFFEVYLSPHTGGIRQLKGYGRSPNRLSQQISYRFTRERIFPAKSAAAKSAAQGSVPPEGTTSEVVSSLGQEIRTHYSEMRALKSEVLCSGPSLGEIRTSGDIIDQQHERRLAGFTQTYRIWRNRPIVEIDLELQLDQVPDGEPWHNYYCCRFAWNDEGAALTGAALSGAYTLGEERCESPHYIEIADDELRTTILPLGLPFHRKAGPRMLDSLLVVAGETRRKFRFVIAIDQPFPMQAALDAMVPPAIIRTTQGPPRSGKSGWFLHLDSRQVQVLGLLPLMSEPPSEADEWDRPSELPPAPNDPGFCVRLIETEGRSLRLKLRCFRQPVRARQRDFLGKSVCNLSIDGDAVVIDLIGHEIADVEVFFS
jgi:alpha-mannosidase